MALSAAGFPGPFFHKTLPLLIAALAAAVSAPCPAQEVHLESHAPVEKAAAGPELHIAPLRVNVDLVLVPVTVTDAMNRPVLGLNKEDFALYEGDAAEEIRYFSSEDMPISVGVVLDVSRSMTDKIELARAALGEFFENANPEDDYFVITFSDRPAVLADVTTSVGTIQAKLAEVKPQGHTALLDAIYLGMHKLRTARYQRRALVVISDGGDNHSRFTAAELKNLVMEADVEIYGSGIYSSVFHTPEEWMGKRLMTQITEATGGHTITVNNARDLPDAASAISTELRNQYVLGYAPATGQGPGWHKIRVKLTPRDKAGPRQVYWRRGYMGTGQ